MTKLGEARFKTMTLAFSAGANRRVGFMQREAGVPPKETRCLVCALEGLKTPAQNRNRWGYGAIAK
jgi:hypothetical protein